MIGTTQENGYLKIVAIQAGSKGRAAVYDCECTRVVNGLPCGGERRVRADVWRTEEAKMCKRCVKLAYLEGKDDEDVTSRKSIPAKLVPRIVFAMIKHLSNAKKQGVRLDKKELERFAVEMAEMPALLKEYEQPFVVHREDVLKHSFDVYHAPKHLRGEIHAS